MADDPRAVPQPAPQQGVSTQPVVAAPTPAAAPPQAAAAPAAVATNNLPPPAGAQGQPPTPAAGVQTTPQGGQAQSEPTPTVEKPLIDPRPYAWLAQNDPTGKAMVDKAATEAGVSPQRLAYHWYAEGALHTEVPNGKAGEVGPMQVMPQTASQYNQGGKLDIHDPQDNLRIGANYMRHLDDAYGHDSVSSVAAYQGGEGSANDIAAHPDQAWNNHPRTMQYAKDAFPGQTVGPQHFVGQSSLDPKGLVNAGVQGGPDGFIHYAIQSSPRGMPLTDIWQHAEGALTQAFLEKGDIVGAQHARDYVLQMSHAGSNSNLMAAHQSLTNGDATGAANYLAKAHAFFPDSTMGRFSVDGKGNLWADRMDENNPTQAIGKPQQVTPQSIASLLNQTTDPAKYLQLVMAEQKNAADVRVMNNHGDYYRDLNASRERIAQTNADSRETVGAAHDTSRETVGAAHDTSRETVADTRAQARQGYGPQAALSRSADTEAGKLYSGDAMPDTPAIQRAAMGEVHHDARMNGAAPPAAEAAARGLADKTLMLLRGSDGRYGVVDPKTKQPIAYLSKETGDRLSGGAGGNVQPQQQGVPASPVGAAPGVAQMAAGVTNNLAGTQPTQGTQPPPSQGVQIQPQPTIH